MSAPVSRKERVRPPVVLSKNSCPSNRESCLRELEELRERAHETMVWLGHEYFEQCHPGPANDFKQPKEEYLKNVVSLFQLSVKLLKAVDLLLAWNADVMPGRTTL
jgi:hypothetical protein